MFELHYRSFVPVEDLLEDECSVHRASAGVGKRFWLLWWNSKRETDGVLEVFCVPIIPSGSYSENGPGGRSWGCNRAGVGRWMIGPSVNVLDDEGAHQVVAGHAPTSISLWHKTPLLTGVPEDEPWARGQQP